MAAPKAMGAAVALVLALSWPACGESFNQKFSLIKKEATKSQLYAFLYDVPKGGDIHHHLLFSTWADTWYAFATDKARTRGNEFYTRTRFGNCPDDDGTLIRFRTIQRATWRKLSDCRKAEYQLLSSLDPELKAEWLSSLKLDRPGEGRNEFFDVIGSRVGEMSRDPYLFMDLLVETMRRYGAEGLRYLETQAGPSSFRDQDGNLIDTERGVQFFRDRLSRPDAKATGVTVRFQLAVGRSSPRAEEQLEGAFAFVDRHRDLWTGINIVGREDDRRGYALRFLDTFRRMRRTYSGIHLSLHGGEVDSPGHEVRDTLLLGAERIGHGVNLISDPDTMLLMRNGRYLVEVSLISNRLLEYTPDLSKHPFPEFLRFGIPVCLNTDDPGAWDSNLTDEYFTAVTTYNLTWDEIVQIGRNSLQYSFVEPPVKERLVAEYEKAVQEFERRYNVEDWRGVVARVHPEVSGYAARNLR